MEVQSSPDNSFFGYARFNLQNSLSRQKISLLSWTILRHSQNDNAFSSESETSGAFGVSGLRNLGNTCFMNSILQCLSHTRLLLEFCINGEYKADVNKANSCMKGALISAYAKLMESISRGTELVSPNEFKSQIARFAKRFVGYSQQDAEEFLIYLLEGLHEDLNRTDKETRKLFIVRDCSDLDHLSPSVKAIELWNRFKQCENSKIVDTFMGYMRSSLICTNCGHTSNSFEPFLDLSLPIPLTSSHVELEDCLSLFTQEEILDGDEMPMCSRCNNRQKFKKTLTIQKFPQILIFHLKRFRHDRQQWSKLSTFVNCPLAALDLTKFSADENASPAVYDLYAVSNHSGTPFTGHYTAAAKNPYTMEWSSFNDSRVSSISRSRVCTADAYLLFYEISETTCSRL